MTTVPTALLKTLPISLLLLSPSFCGQSSGPTGEKTEVWSVVRNKEELELNCVGVWYLTR